MLISVVLNTAPISSQHCTIRYSTVTKIYLLVLMKLCLRSSIHQKVLVIFRWWWARFSVKWSWTIETLPCSVEVPNSLLGFCFWIIFSTHDSIKGKNLRFVIFNQCFNFNKLLFNHRKFFPSCHILIFKDVNFFYYLTNKSKWKSIPKDIFLQILLTLSM